MNNKFYYGTVKKMLVVFATLFDDIKIDVENRELLVPLHYAPKAKFYEILTKNPDQLAGVNDVALPVMGYEMTSLNFAPEKNLNQLSSITAHDNTTGKKGAFNRVPWELTFDLYIATKRFEDSLKIIEQIIPFFAPEFTVKVRDNENLNLETNITISMTAASYDIEYEGSFDTNRVITWDLSFTMKTYFYHEVKNLDVIKNIIINFRDSEVDKKFADMSINVISDDEITETINDPNPNENPYFEDDNP